MGVLTEVSAYGARNGGAAWFALYIWARHEKKVAEHLKNKGIETFLPLYRKIHHWKNRIRAEVDLPLFPSYLFTRIALSEQFRVLEVPGVLAIVGNGRHPVPIDTRDIERLQFGLQVSAAQPHPYLTVGDRVRVVAGPFEGMEGILLREKQHRVVLSINQIKSSIVVELDPPDLEVIDTTRSVEGVKDQCDHGNQILHSLCK